MNLQNKNITNGNQQLLKLKVPSETETKKQKQKQNPMKKFINYRNCIEMKTLTSINNKCVQKSKALNMDRQSLKSQQNEGLNPASIINHFRVKQEVPTEQTKLDQELYKHFLKQNVVDYQAKKINMEQFLEVRTSSIYDEYQIKQKIGQGTFGTVFRAICKKSQEERAIKMLKGKYLKGEKNEQFMAEMTLQSKLQHPAIIKLYNLFKNNNNYYVVMEYCKGGSIIEILGKLKSKSQKIMIDIMRQVLSALSYLHSMNIIHRDMKLDNIVFVGNTEDLENISFKIRIIDFGTAVQTKYKVTKNYPITGTYSYMAPEVLDKILNEKSDIWSAAVIMIVLLTGTRPFHGVNQQKTKEKVMKKEINYNQSPFNTLSQHAKSLLKLMLDRNFYKRISATDALKHPWFSSISKQKSLSPESVEKLKNFYIQNNLISVVESYLVLKKTSQQDRQYFSNIFNSIDADSNGTIQISQFLQLMKKTYNQNYNEAQMKKLVKTIDRNQEGRIDFNQFMIAMYNRQKLFVKESLNEAFDYFDKDKTGFLEVHQLKNILKGSDNQQVEYFIDKLDVDKNNKISREQFVNYLSQF